MNIEEYMVNIWNIVEECPLKVVLPGTPHCEYTDVKVKTTRPYIYVKRKDGTNISKIKSSSVYYWIGIDEDSFLSNVSNEHCCSNICI